MTPRWCFQCGVEYVDTVASCVECGVATIAYPPTPPERVGGDDDPQIAYELHSWSFEARLEVESVLRAAAVDHGWDGPSLIVLEADEETVDALLADIDPGEDADDSGVLLDLDELADRDDGIEPYPIVEGLFLAADVLGRSPRDVKARNRVGELAGVVAGMTTPFGFDRPVWSAIQLSSTELADAIDTDDDEAIADGGAALASTLRPYL